MIELNKYLNNLFWKLLFFETKLNLKKNEKYFLFLYLIFTDEIKNNTFF